MALTDTTPFDEKSFSGTVRLFPLPNLVLFPHAIQPLHIFEPRYRAMLEDALSDDRLIAMALLRPDDEENYFGVPAIETNVCLGKIISAVKMPDGRSNILLGGMRRAQIVNEIETDLAYRTACVNLVDDFYSDEKEHIQLIKDELIEALDCWLPDVLRRDEHFRAIFEGALSLGAMSDIIANCLPIDVSVKQQLLDEANVERRGLILLDSIGEMEQFDGPDANEVAHMKAKTNAHDALRPSKTDRTFPPNFSEN